MRYCIIAIITVLTGLYACSPEINILSENPNNYGGCFRYNEPFELKTFFPQSFNDKVSGHIIAQVYEGLIKFEPKNLSLVPALATNWEVDSLETTYRFFLRTNAFFHDDLCFTGGTGRKITAFDFVYTFQLLATKHDLNQNFYGTIDQVLGTFEHYESDKPDTEIKGIVAESDSVLVITLKKSNPLFLYFIANPAASVIPREAFEKYGYKSRIGSGPFVISGDPKPKKPLILIRNPHYYKQDNNGNYLPYLDSVIISFYSSTAKELLMLEEGKLDMALDVQGVDLTNFLERNITLFDKHPPKLLLVASHTEPDASLQNIISTNIKGYQTNSQEYIDLTWVYLETKKPSKKQFLNSPNCSHSEQ